jgi:hypothetical protein
MTVQTLTVQLPEPIFRYLQQIAVATQRSLEQLAQQSIVGNLPPSVATMPSEMCDELLALQNAPVTKLIQVANSQVSPAQQARHLELLEKNSADMISPPEQDELAALRLAADRLMLRKVYAWSVLRWRGQPVPTLDELPLEQP